MAERRNNNPQFVLTVEDSPVAVYVGQTFSVRLWAEYSEEAAASVENFKVSCSRLEEVWDQNLHMYYDDLPLEGPVQGTVRAGHAIIFNLLMFTPEAANRSWKLEFQLFINDEWVAEATCDILVGPVGWAGRSRR